MIEIVDHIGGGVTPANKNRRINHCTYTLGNWKMRKLIAKENIIDKELPENVINEIKDLFHNNK